MHGIKLRRKPLPRESPLGLRWEIKIKFASQKVIEQVRWAMNLCTETTVIFLVLKFIKQPKTMLLSREFQRAYNYLYFF